MRVEVINTFLDKYDTSIAHKPGQVLEWDDQSRITDCVKRGLIKVLPEVQTETKPKKKTTKAKQ